MERVSEKMDKNPLKVLRKFNIDSGAPRGRGKGYVQYQKNGCPPGKIKIGELCLPEHCSQAASIYKTKEKQKLGKRGFLLPDGSIIATGSTGHELISRLYTGKLASDESIDIFAEFALFYRFLDECHAIRFLDLDKGPDRKILTVESVHKPTEAQVKQLTRMVQDKDKLYADRSDPKRNDYICSYEMLLVKPRPLDIQRWISRCWP